MSEIPHSVLRKQHLTLDSPRIVFFYPGTGWDIKNVTALLPLSVLYMVRPLRLAGFDVRIIDQRLDRNWRNTLRTELQIPQTIALGISSMTGHQIAGGIEAASIARKARPGLPVIWGGVHPSLMPRQTLENDGADIVVRGEGETAIVNLAEALRDEKPFTGLPGVAYFDGNTYRENGPASAVKLDDVLLPDYDAVNVEDYITTQTLGLRDLAITTSRGCPNRCAYCYNVPYSGRRWRAQSAAGVLAHIEKIVTDFDVQGVLVKDDNFFVDKKRAGEIAAGLPKLPRKVVVRAECRADYIARKWDQDFLNELSARGFREMTVGAESGSDETLELLCKDITVADIREANRRLAKAKIAAKFTFMAGYPNESPADIRKTLDLMLDLIRESPYARVTPLHLFAPYPGTELFDEAIRQGYEPPKDLAGWADVDFHQVSLPWLPGRFARKLERASVATYFLDGRTIPEYFARQPLRRILAKIYGWIVRLRAKRFFFALMPEIGLINRLRKN